MSGSNPAMAQQAKRVAKKTGRGAQHMDAEPKQFAFA